MTICQCHHLSNFAVLSNINEQRVNYIIQMGLSKKLFHFINNCLQIKKLQQSNISKMSSPEEGFGPD